MTNTPKQDEGKMMSDYLGDTQLYSQLRGSYQERLQTLEKWSPEFMRAAILDNEYNDFLRERADYEDGEAQLRPDGKRIPYIGWFWRHINFHSLENVPIGDCGDFIGFMPNNKWGYRERNLSKREALQVLEIIDAAMFEDQKSGLLNEIREKTHAELDRLWPLLESFGQTGKWEAAY